MRKSEERLRDLHPYAMARYDRLRADGMGPAEAMRETAPLFALSPRARARPSRRCRCWTPGPALTWPGPPTLQRQPASPTTSPAPKPRNARPEHRDALQARARAAGPRSSRPRAELRTVLETVTNLPADVIDRVIRPGPADGLAQSELDGRHRRTRSARPTWTRSPA